MQPKKLAPMTPMLSVLLFATTTWAGAGRPDLMSSVDSAGGLCSVDDGTVELACKESITTGTDVTSARERHPRTVSREHFRGPVDRSVTDAARGLLDLPLGSEVVLDVDGVPYGFRLELHYHPPGYVGGPIGWHKGVTLYHVAEDTY